VKRLWHLVLALLLAASLHAATNETAVKLAVVAESPAAGAAADLLIAEFSHRTNLQVLDRAEVDRICREQGISAAHRDDLKLGRLLGADGLLVLDSVLEQAASPGDAHTAEPQKPTTLNLRLVAVKPAVVLRAERFVNRAEVTPEWAGSYARRLDPLLPKLTILAKDAIPISVVNFRSAVSSSDAPLVERQLQTLAIQRLSREPRLFVLERQQLQQLREEKYWSSDETAFWNGAWLLEGTLDQNGYSKETVTLNAKLTPAKGGAPLEFELSGCRTNAAEPISALAAKVIAALQITPTVTDWKAADEAARFNDEAQWAFRWGAFLQAQSSADAAWALGKRDLHCALLRVRAQAAQIPIVLESGSAQYEHGRPANFVNIYQAPNRQFCVIAQQALECYEEFCRLSPEGEPKVLWRGAGWSDWHSSDWYQAGIEALDAASRVLQHFNYSPAARQGAAGELATLRAQARLVAERIWKTPSVHDSYFVESRRASYDELSRTLEDSPNIFACIANWGCFWQEEPEHAVALYRQLLESPAFCYVHAAFWNRPKTHPRLVGWNDEDAKRIPQVWESYLHELNASTNVLWQMEAKALAKADAPDRATAGRIQQEWHGLVRSNLVELLGNRVDLFYLGWHFPREPGSEDLDSEYWYRTVPGLKAALVLEDQKKFLREFQPCEFKSFVKKFEVKSYTQQQAQELLPLVLAYRSNLLAQAEAAESPQKFRLRSDASMVEYFLLHEVEGQAHPQPVAASPVKPPRPTKPLERQMELLDTPTNIIVVKAFLELPLGWLARSDAQSIDVTAHHWQEGKLLLDLEYERQLVSLDTNGQPKVTRSARFPTVAILDTGTTRWQVMPGVETDPQKQNPFYDHTTFWRGSVFTSQGGKVRKYEISRKVWNDLELPEIGNCALFTIHDRLYAATENMIVEILEGGASMNILASNRRQPPITALDTENLGKPALFAGPGGTLRAVTPRKISSWDGTHWTEVCGAPEAWQTAWISDESLLFYGDGWILPPGIWRLPMENNHLEYWLGQEQNANRQDFRPIPAVPARPPPQLMPLWKIPPGLPMRRIPTVSRGTDLLLLHDHAKAVRTVKEQDPSITSTKIIAQDGYHAALWCYSSNYTDALPVYLKFEHDNAILPVTANEMRLRYQPSLTPEDWICLGNGRMYFGREIYGMRVTGGMDHRPRVGVWVAAMETIDQEIERQKKIQDARKLQGSVLAQKTHQGLQEKFDLDHDGKTSGEEKEAALCDEPYVASQLDQIDTNHNGWLDAAELKFFDANANNVLDANEQAGIELAQRLLAARLLRQFDTDGNGLLDRREFDLLRSFSSLTRTMSGNGFPDENHDNWIDIEELQVLCERETVFSLVRGQSMGRGTPIRRLPGETLSPEARNQFKVRVENYWKNGGTVDPWQQRQLRLAPPVPRPPVAPPN